MFYRQLAETATAFSCKEKNKGYTICIQKGCNAHPVMCFLQACPCKLAHLHHNMHLVDGFIRMLKDSQIPTSQQVQFGQALLQTTRKIQEQIQEVHRRYADHINSLSREDLRYQTLKEQLLQSGRTSEPITGDTMMKLMEQIKLGLNAREGFIQQLLALQEKELRIFVEHIIDKITNIWSERKATARNTIGFLRSSSYATFPLDRRPENIIVGVKIPKMQTFNVPLSSTVRNVQQLVKQRCGMAEEDQILSYHGKQLQPELLLSEYSVDNGSTLKLKKKDCKRASLSRNIEQRRYKKAEIKKDNTNQNRRQRIGDYDILPEAETRKKRGYRAGSEMKNRARSDL